MHSSTAVEIRRHSPETPWSYGDLDQRQRAVADRVRMENGPGALLLNEVSPVITRGRRTQGTDVFMTPEGLAQVGVELYPVDRGGLATYHGPGQWVLFAVDSLERLTGDRRGVRKAVNGLLEIALEVGRQYDPRAEIREGAEMGVWTPRGKFAAVGVHIEKGVLLHGLSVNGFRTPTSFMGLRPCGLDAPVDFLLGQTPNVEQPGAFVELGDALCQVALKRFWQNS
jgi:lipoate-protein ligase B